MSKSEAMVKAIKKEMVKDGYSLSQEGENDLKLTLEAIINGTLPPGLTFREWLKQNG